MLLTKSKQDEGEGKKKTKIHKLDIKPEIEEKKEDGYRRIIRDIHCQHLSGKPEKEITNEKSYIKLAGQGCNLNLMVCEKLPLWIFMCVLLGFYLIESQNL